VVSTGSTTRGAGATVGHLGDPEEHWPVHEVETIWHGQAPFSVRRDTISTPDDPATTFGRLVLEHPGAVVVLAVDDDDRAFVLHQYRHPVGRRLVELPAGLLDVPDEDPLLAAKRELQEEALLVAGTWEHLLTTYPSPGLSSERIDIFLATDLRDAPDRGDFEPAHEEADMTTSWVPVHELVEAFLDHRITDGPLGNAVLAYTLRGGRAGGS
jgi:8-oxo-dGDP phosphatase